MKANEQLICLGHLRLFGMISIVLSGQLVLYELLKTNIYPANLSYHTCLYRTVPFTWYQEAIMLMIVHRLQSE